MFFFVQPWHTFRFLFYFILYVEWVGWVIFQIRMLKIQTKRHKRPEMASKEGFVINVAFVTKKKEIPFTFNDF